MPTLVGFMHHTTLEGYERIKACGYLYTSYSVYFLHETPTRGLGTHDAFHPHKNHFPGVYMHPLYAGVPIEMLSDVGLVFDINIASQECNWHFNPHDNFGYINGGTIYAFENICDSAASEIVFHDAISLDECAEVVTDCKYYIPPDRAIENLEYVSWGMKPFLLSGVDFGVNLGTLAFGQFTTNEYRKNVLNALQIILDDDIYDSVRNTINAHLTCVELMESNNETVTPEYVDRCLPEDLMIALLRCRHIAAQLES